MSIDYELPDFDALCRQHNIDAFREGGAYAGVASIPRRALNLKLVLDSLYHQIDHFFVYLNDYETVPEWLDDSKFTVFRSQDFVDLNATGKVFFAQVVDKGYYFTLDDDFIYPGDYASRMIGTIQKYDDRVAACVHGSIFPPDPEYYYMRSAIHQYQNGLSHDQFVCLPGTGSFCAKAGTLDLSLKRFLPQVMVDLACAIFCKETKVPLVSVARAEKWLQNTDRDGLYQQFVKDKTHHTYYAKTEGPWDFAEYTDAIQSVFDAMKALGRNPITDETLLCDIDAFVAAQQGLVPRQWQATPQHYLRMAEHIRSSTSAFNA